MPEGITAQNLLRRTIAEKIIRPPGFYASIALDILTVLSAGTLGFFYRGYLRSEASVIWAVLFLVLFLALSVFGMLLTKNLGRRIGILALAFLGTIVFFYDSPFPFLLGGGAAAFGFAVWGEIRSRAELKNSLEIKFFRVIRPQLGKLITAVSLLAVFLYLPQWSAADNFISPAAFGRLYGFTAGAAERFYPELIFNSSVEDFARSLARFQLRNNLVFLQLSPMAQEQTVAEAAKTVLAGMDKWSGAEVLPETPFASFAYEVTLKNLKVWQDMFGGQLKFAWGVAMFLILRSAGLIIYPILAGLAFFIYQSLLAADFIKIVGESRTQETLEYS